MDEPTSSETNADFLDEFFQEIAKDPVPPPPVTVPSLQDDDDTFLHTLFHGEKPDDTSTSDGINVKTEPPSTSPPAAEVTRDGKEFEHADEPLKNSPPSSPHLSTADGQKSVESTEEHPERQLDDGVFKRPFTPRSSPVRTEGSSSTSDAPLSHPPLRSRRQFHRMEPHPTQKCFLTGVKRKRAGTESGEIINMLSLLKDGNKLLIPDLLLMDYMQEAGLEVEETKVVRLMGAGAEHHTACIIQDAMQVLLDGQHEKRRNPPKDKDKDTAAPKQEKTVQKPKPAKTGRPASAHSKAGSGKSSKKSKKKGKESEEPSEDSSAILPESDKDTNSGVAELLETSSIADPAAATTSTAGEADDEAAEKSTVKSIVSKDEKEGTAAKTKREREKEAEKRHVLSLEHLTPVLREHGYHVGRPPYFVN